MIGKRKPPRSEQCIAWIRGRRCTGERVEGSTRCAFHLAAQRAGKSDVQGGQS